MNNNTNNKENFENENKQFENLLFSSDPAKNNFPYNIVYYYYGGNRVDNIFCVFKSKDEILYLIYNEKLSIIAYNISIFKKIKEIENATDTYIQSFRYHFDNINNRDIILSVSRDNNLKIWNINNWECLLNIKKIYIAGRIFSACFLNDKNKIYIITSNNNHPNHSEEIRVFDFLGNEITKINDSKDETFFIDSYYDNKLSNFYIITGNKDNAKSYDYNQNKLYHIYCDQKDNEYNEVKSLIIYNLEEQVRLIGSSACNKIGIWNFHTGEMLKKIEIGTKYNQVYGLCLWNNKYLYASQGIVLIDLEQGKVVKKYSNSYEYNIKKIIHPELGECFITLGEFGEKKSLKIWVNKTHRDKLSKKNS